MRGGGLRLDSLCFDHSSLRRWSYSRGQSGLGAGGRYQALGAGSRDQALGARSLRRRSGDLGHLLKRSSRVREGDHVLSLSHHVHMLLLLVELLLVGHGQLLLVL